MQDDEAGEKRKKSDKIIGNKSPLFGGNICLKTSGGKRRDNTKNLIIETFYSILVPRVEQAESEEEKDHLRQMM